MAPGYLLSGRGGLEAGVTNLWAQCGFFTHGGKGLLIAGGYYVFLRLSGDGGITAAEADDQAHSIPKATNQVIYRILIFYIGALAILLSLYPWAKVVEGGNPFVLIFRAINYCWVTNILNLVVLTAALSVYNSCVYSNSRMLHGLARQGHGPQSLARVDRRGVLVAALGVSAIATAICVLLDYLMPSQAFGLLMALVVSALVINWIMISLAHWKFRRKKRNMASFRAFRRCDARWHLPLPAFHGGYFGDYAPHAWHGHFGVFDSGIAGGVRHRFCAENLRLAHADPTFVCQPLLPCWRWAVGGLFAHGLLPQAARLPRILCPVLHLACPLVSRFAFRHRVSSAALIPRIPLGAKGIPLSLMLECRFSSRSL